MPRSAEVAAFVYWLGEYLEELYPNASWATGNGYAAYAALPGTATALLVSLSVFVIGSKVLPKLGLPIFRADMRES